MFTSGKLSKQKVKLESQRAVSASLSGTAHAAPGKCGEWFRKHARPGKGYTQERTSGSIAPTPCLLAPASSHPTEEELCSVMSPVEPSPTFQLRTFLQTNYAASESGTRQSMAHSTYFHGLLHKPSRSKEPVHSLPRLARMRNLRIMQLIKKKIANTFLNNHTFNPSPHYCPPNMS